MKQIYDFLKFLRDDVRPEILGLFALVSILSLASHFHMMNAQLGLIAIAIGTILVLRIIVKIFVYCWKQLWKGFLTEVSQGLSAGLSRGFTRGFSELRTTRR